MSEKPRAPEFRRKLVPTCCFLCSLNSTQSSQFNRQVASDTVLSLSVARDAEFSLSGRLFFPLPPVFENTVLVGFQGATAGLSSSAFPYRFSALLDKPAVAPPRRWFLPSTLPKPAPFRGSSSPLVVDRPSRCRRERSARWLGSSAAIC